MAAVGQRRPHSPDHLHNSQAIVKRQRTDDQQLIIGSVTKDVSRGDGWLAAVMSWGQGKQ
jgi:hypothetical protein